MLRDKIMLNNSIFFLSTECRGCGLKDHLIENCEKIHLVMNRDTKIRQHLQSKPTLERKGFLRKRKKFNSLKILNQCASSFSDLEESFLIQDEEKEIETIKGKSEFEIETILKKEINPPLISTNESNELKKEVIIGNLKKDPSVQSDTNDLIYVSKISIKSEKKEKAELYLDKLQNYNYFYPDFNFENVSNRLVSARKIKTGISRENRRKGRFN